MVGEASGWPQCQASTRGGTAKIEVGKHHVTVVGKGVPVFNGYIQPKPEPRDE